MNMAKKIEENLHKSICQFIKFQYPKAIFNTDMSGVKLSKYQAKKMKGLRSSNGFPDIAIYEKNNPIGESYEYSALFLEVKKETPYKLNGELKKDAHLEEQDEMHIKLRERGYKADFVWSLEQAIVIINNYMNNV